MVDGGGQGLICIIEGFPFCLPYFAWCSPDMFSFKCDQLEGKSATGKTIDSNLCSNQSFWEGKPCDSRFLHEISNGQNVTFKGFRSTGARPGQCWAAGLPAADGSSNIRGPKDEDCGMENTNCTLEHDELMEQMMLLTVFNCMKENQAYLSVGEFKDDGKLLSKVMKNWECFLNAMNSTLFGKKCEEDNIICTARDGYWAGREICLEKRYRCDNFLQCEDGSDEVDCEETYQSKNIFTKDHLFMCKSPFLTIKSKQNKTGKFFPMRGIWYSTVTPIVIPSWFLSTLVIFIQSSIDKSNFQFP